MSAFFSAEEEWPDNETMEKFARSTRVEQQLYIGVYEGGLKRADKFVAVFRVI